MDLKFDSAKWQQDSENALWLMLNISPEDKPAAKEFVRTMEKKPYLAALKPYKQKRSLDANAYLWVLCQKLAEVLQSSKDEVYIEMLSRYGVFTHVVVKPQLINRVKQEWRAVRELGEIKVGGQTGVQLQCFFGSSGYDTKEMAKLIDGIVSECKELDILTETPEQLARMKMEWGVKSDTTDKTKP